jgi:hypothetical protein
MWPSQYHALRRPRERSSGGTRSLQLEVDDGQRHAVDPQSAQAANSSAIRDGEPIS